LKPPTAALAEDCRGERCGKRRRGRRQVGVRKAIAVDVSKEPWLTPKLGQGSSSRMSLAGAR
jgi:hypothetical protein